MELDSKIESLCRLREVLSCLMGLLLGVGFVLQSMLLCILVVAFSDPFEPYSYDPYLKDKPFLAEVWPFFCFFAFWFFVAFVSVYGIRKGKGIAVFVLSCFTCILLTPVYSAFYGPGGWLKNWPFFVGPIILIALYSFSIFVMVRHLWLMRKARIRDEKLAVQEG